ncbi:MAG: hypothetical protein KC656_37435, partial [Myxococcales bacterium]|nr:hypothetical protein [Myxococcales bacterium]
MSKKLGITYPVLHDATAQVAGKYGVSLFPTTIVVHHGEIAHVRMGEVTKRSLEAMVADPSMVQVRGERRELSVLFSDIRDFTSHSERMDPLQLVAFLNEYLTPMTRAVMDNRGMVDKFIGDAVMALFGAPVPDEHHAIQGCRAALDMHTALESIKPIAAELDIDLAIGVGVNSGEVALGNLGSGD